MNENSASKEKKGREVVHYKGELTPVRSGGFSVNKRVDLVDKHTELNVDLIDRNCENTNQKTQHSQHFNALMIG